MALGLAAFLGASLTAAGAAAQPSGGAGGPPATGAPAQAPLQLPPPKKKPAKPRTKPLLTTVGMVPTAHDFGGEADMVGTATVPVRPPKGRAWKYVIRGFLRPTAHTSIGPRNDETPGKELHGKPEVVGAQPDDWGYVGLVPATKGSLYFTVENATVSGSVIIDADTFYDAGYRNILKMGGFSQAFVTLKLPDLFGSWGGLAWTLGAFSNRYGLAGPEQRSTGYYHTYLFGRTNVSGESLAAHLDLADGLELVLEHGLGTKLEIIDWRSPTSIPPQPEAVYLPSQGPVPQGSNFVHHAHAMLMVGDWLKAAGHHMISWSPNDNATVETLVDPKNQPSARLTILGGEVHVDTKRAGNGYFGYSHIKASNILPLTDGISVLHSTDGVSFKNNYFGRLPDPFRPTTSPRDDSGTVETFLFQYAIKLAPLLGYKNSRRDVGLALFSMYNRIRYNDSSQEEIKLGKLKLGGEVQVAPLYFLSLGARFDHVRPERNDSNSVYNAISARAIIHTGWFAREFVMLNYTHFMLGNSAYEVGPYGVVGQKADPDLVTLTAAVSF